MITVKDVKENFEKLDYLATDEIIYDAFNALYMFESQKIDEGQDIYAICLEGPPGAGKTEFAINYTKIANKLFGNVKMVSYQCDATTGKTELFEDINISAAIRNDADNVNIPGKLIEAINEVNKGNKVVLFIDEYDKAREETDAFMLQFLQSGKINSNQHGDLEVKPEYKSNLQVILCKNDMREELSGPLSRRIRILRLEFMTPEMFFTIANKVLIEKRIDDKVDSGLINLVSLMYKIAYDSKELFNRIPSCSEMLRAISDADRFTKIANAPQNIIYNTIVKNMFKSLDDINTFESGLSKSEEGRRVEELVKKMKSDTTDSTEIDLNHLISTKLFTDESNKLAKKTEEMQNLIDEYKSRFKKLEAKKIREIENEKRKILLENGKLVSTTTIPKIVRNFDDEQDFIKRGFNILEDSYGEWTDLATIYLPKLNHHKFIEKIIEYSNKMNVVIYENGILLNDLGEQKLIVIADTDEFNNLRYRFMSNYLVIPSINMSYIETFMKLGSKVYELEKKQNKISDSDDDFKYSINALIYNDDKLNYTVVDENVYNLNLEGNFKNDQDNISKIVQNFTCDNVDNALDSSMKIMSKQDEKENVKIKTL